MTKICPKIGMTKVYNKRTNNGFEAINTRTQTLIASLKIFLHYNMHSTIALSMAFALAGNVIAAPLQARQDLTLADTVQFIAKTQGSNPSPGVLPDINNWLFVPVHSGAGLNTATLADPSKTSFNLSAPGFFQNGTDAEHSTGAYMTAGFLDDSATKTPWSLVLNAIHQNSSSNPGAYVGPIEFNVGVGTNGFEVFSGHLITSRYVSDTFWACPNIPVEGSEAIVVEATDRYADPPNGCWAIELIAQCAGPISDVNKAAFPSFVQSGCYTNATAIA
ncbi:hypothetical protein N431DRAFT_397950 [Stipitochalara longipes BDJ]|nr:hypothetical protein N431DRAFT_397950 [Stipitochalara longipes BDJ]